MSDLTTKVMLLGYQARRMPTAFLTGMFQAPERNFHNSEEVEIDISRSGEDISIAIVDLSTGARLNTEDFYTNKSFKPPVHKEKGAIPAHQLIKREFGKTPFESVDFQRNALDRATRLITKMGDKIARAMEFQAASVLQSGVVTLIDENGLEVYKIDYGPKVAHFPTAAVLWANANSTKLKDIEDLSNVVRSNGMEDPDLLIMGERAYELFISDTAVQNRINLRRGEIAQLIPADRRGNGGIYRGTIEVGNYSYELWTYGGRYKNPQTGVSTKFIGDNKVVVRASAGRLDATFGGIPTIDRDSRVPQQIFTRLRDTTGIMDLQTKGWITEDGETLFVQAGTRPLMIPTAIDTFGCITV